MPEHSPTSTSDTTPIHRLICRTRRLLRSSWVATGAAIMIALLLGSLLAVTLLDLTVPLWPVFRLAALFVVVVPATIALLARVLWPLLRRLTAGQVAQRIEAHVPKMHNRLLSCIDFEDTARRERQSLVFYRRLVSEVIERLKGFNPSTVIDKTRLQRAGWYMGGTLAAFAIALFVLSDRLPTAMARVFAPFADIPPASGVVYTVEPGNAKILRGEEIPFLAKVEKGEPEQLRLELTPDGGADSLWYDLQPLDDGRWTLTLTGLEKSFAYRVHGGGTWSREYHITLLDRPTITDLHTVLHFPEYMGISEPRVGPPQIAEVIGPQLSTVDVLVQASGDVSTGEIEILEPRVTRTELAARPQRPWFTGKPPAGARLEGAWPAEGSSRRRQPPLQGMHGHGFIATSATFLVQNGETLYADIAIPADKRPETILLQWREGNNLEHRAVWGADKIPLGIMDTASYRRMGPVPSTGEMMRLEVPAALVDLEGKSLQGVNLLLFNGQATLRGAGALGSKDVEKTDFIVSKSFPMQATDERRWFGSFPLDRDGFYRIKLTNELGHANKTMKEAKYVALLDQPPVVLLERPGADITLNEPSKVPLAIAAFDDFGLADLTLHLQRGDGAPFDAKPIKHYPQPVRSDAVLTMLDLSALPVKAGDAIRYHVEARDRKGQSAVTKDFTIRFLSQGKSADKELTQIEKNQEPFRQNLDKLIAQQEKVREQVEKLAAKHATPSDKAREAAKLEETQPKKDTDPTAQQQAAANAERTKDLDDLRRDLGEMAKQEKQNAQLSEEMAENLKQLAEQAEKAPLLPPQIAREMKNAEEAFQKRAVQPLKNLAAQMQQTADPKKAPNDLQQMRTNANRLQRDLEAMRDRMQTLARAEKQVHSDTERAMADLQRETLHQDSKLTARELAELQDAIKALRQQAQNLEKQQDDLMRDQQQPLPEREQRQATLDQEEDKEFAATRRLQGSEEMRRAQQQTGVRNQQARSTPGSPRFTPALGGPMPQMSPHDRTPAGESRDRQAQLREHQADRMDQLSEAEQSLRSDEQTLQSMREQLERAAAQSGEQGSQQIPQSASNANTKPVNGQAQQSGKQATPQDSVPDRQLEEMLHSPGMQRAMQMAERLRQMRGQPGELQSSTTHAATPNTHGNTSPAALEAELAKLDPASRAAILKLQPQVRQELLQGMRDAGPEGYQKFIEDYFKRLTEVKK